MSEDFKPILCIDFDGVIHSYEKGWQNGVIYGSVTSGFWEWAEEAAKLFKLVVYSLRSSEQDKLTEMAAWMIEQRRLWRQADGKSCSDALSFEFADKKPPAFLTIDDRAIQFQGDWTLLEPRQLRKFKPWNAA